MKRYLIALMILIVGLGLIIYPQISIKIYEKQSGYQILNYNNLVNEMDYEERNHHFKKAKEYNDSLTGNPVQDPFLIGSGKQIPSNYYEVLKFDDGILATVEIPSIGLDLPIYHGTSEAVLQKGIGHMEGTSFPIGGKGNHSVITGHTGLAHAKMFTDLTSVNEGDLIYIEVIDKTFAFEVSKISVVLPDNLSVLETQSDEDLLSLITCTPFGINSHRLVVTGHRVEYKPEVKESIKPKEGKTEAERALSNAIFITTAVVSSVLVTVLLIKNKKSKK